MPDEWRTILRLTGMVTGQGADADVEAIDDFVAGEAVRRELGTPGSRLAGRDAGEIAAALGGSEAARSGCSTCCSAPGPTATASARTPTG